MNGFMGPLANLGPVLGFLRIRSFQALPALRDLEELLTERTQESERLRAEIGHLGEIAAENTFLQGLDILTGLLREAHGPTPEIERAWRPLAKRRVHCRASHLTS